MKKFIYITGIASANLMFLGAIFKVQHWPGAGILLTVSVFLFCFIFLPLALYQSYQNSPSKKYKTLYIASFIVFFIVFIGALFKVQHWPGAGLLLLVGIPIPFLLFLPMYLIQTRKDKNYSMVNFMGIMFGMTFIAVFSALLSINVSRSILDKFQNQFYENQKLTSVFMSANNQGDDKVRSKSKELCQFIDQLKSEMLLKSGNNPNPSVSTMIMMAENTDIPTAVLFNNEKYSNMDELKVKLNSFKQAVLSSENIDSELKKLAESLFNLEDNVQGGTWENKEFSTYYLVLVLDALTRIEGNVLFVEQECANNN